VPFAISDKERIGTGLLLVRIRRVILSQRATNPVSPQSSSSRFSWGPFHSPQLWRYGQAGDLPRAGTVTAGYLLPSEAESIIGAPERRKGLKRFTWIAALVVLVTCNRSRGEGDPSLVIESRDLFAEYQTNEAAANQKYKGRLVEVTGVTESVGVDATGSPYVGLSGGQLGIGRVQCLFPKEAAEEIARIQKGRVLTVVGTVSGMGAINVLLENSQLR